MIDFRTAVEVEFNSYCQQVIASRIGDSLASPGPIFSDVKKFSPGMLRGHPQVLREPCGITAGFPCQVP